MPQLRNRLSAYKTLATQTLHALTNSILIAKTARQKSRHERSPLEKHMRFKQLEQADEMISRLRAALEKPRVTPYEWAWLLRVETQAIEVPTFYWTRRQIREVIELERGYERFWESRRRHSFPVGEGLRREVREARERLEEALGGLELEEDWDIREPTSSSDMRYAAELIYRFERIHNWIEESKCPHDPKDDFDRAEPYIDQPGFREERIRVADMINELKSSVEGVSVEDTDIFHFRRFIMVVASVRGLSYFTWGEKYDIVELAKKRESVVLYYENVKEDKEYIRRDRVRLEKELRATGSSFL
ncbi:MAG: hypothetical protein Q9195_001227 [Heterodermia aff. obscurata]